MISIIIQFFFVIRKITYYNFSYNIFNAILNVQICVIIIIVINTLWLDFEIKKIKNYKIETIRDSYNEAKKVLINHKEWVF